MIGRTTSAPRIMGRIGFVHVFIDGKFQQISCIPDYESWPVFEKLIAGDIIEFEKGQIYITKTGEPTIALNEHSRLKLLQRPVAGMPDKSQGVSLETSRANKHLALIQEIVSKDKQTPYRDALILRARVLRQIRGFLDARGYIEVTTPTLIYNPIGSDATPFETTTGEYLRIAPELELKKLIVGGFDKIYEIGKSFRNEGLSQKHNPEFTMLEFYTVGINSNRAFDLTLSLLQSVGINWGTCSTKTFGTNESTFSGWTQVVNFPANESPLAKSENGIAERWELYFDDMEIANGYTELQDPEIQKANFAKQGVVDDSYINALEIGLPPCAGVGIGIDRLLMYMTGRNIKEVI